jgi:tRNA A-37 threonylcarbamoyl transferase component Bud32
MVAATRRQLSVKVGDKLEGRYEIIGLIDVGGMGAVFLAEHMLMKRRFALKALHPELATDVAMIQRFMNEAHAAGTLGHPNIVEATDMGFANGKIPFIVFEYLEGTLLTEEIYRVQGMSPRRALTIARKIASALDAAHNANIVHLDLKCDNVFLTDKDDVSDHVKVLDFGISKFLELDGDATQPAVPMGTPEFMAPEQIKMPDCVDKRADVYALGVCLYEMLTATRPFAGDDPRLLMHRIVYERPPSLASRGVGADIEALVMRLMEKDREARPQSMAEVVEQIDALLTAMRPGDSLQPLPASASVVAVSHPPAPRRSVLPWLAAMLLAVGAGIALHVMNPEPIASAAAPVRPAPRLDADAQRLATVLAAHAQTAQVRVGALARAPMLRAAIETDGATIADMVRSEGLVERAPGETIEFFQLQNGKPHSLLRLPASHPALAPTTTEPTLVRAGEGLEVQISAPITNQVGEPSGMIAIATTVDGAALHPAATDARDVALLGLDQPLVLAGTRAATYEVRQPIQVPPPLHAPSLALAAALPPVAAAPTVGDATPDRRLLDARDACFALGGLLLLAVCWRKLRG